ncbi:MAG: T9SS type A sorting domain-containing protein [Saprospiraceae bacterium]
MRAIVFILLLFSLSSQAQDQHFQRLSFPVNFNGQNLAFPFAGGLNAPQFSPADLNNDGIQDLVIFDRAGNVLLTFLNNGTANEIDYTFAPEYACYFPVLNDYMLMRDYNNDGAADIFCASQQLGSQEMQVFTGYYENNILKFTPFNFYYPNCPTCDTRYIWYPDEIPGFWNNLPISKADVPDVNDIDGDGDLDLLTFEASVGGHVWYFKNMSVEQGFGTDSLHFELTNKCWGGFYESGLEACKNSFAPQPGDCSQGLLGPNDERGNRHPGSTVLTYDKDNDGDREIILGDISFSCLNMMTNCGDALEAWMCEQDTAFPSNSVPVDLPVFPGAFILDVNNDGMDDMLVAPNNRTIGDDRKCAWLYLNDDPDGHNFELDSKTFLVNHMIDMGTSSHPAIVDVNADGKMDIVVGTYGYFTFGNPNNARLFLFLNNGTFNDPSFVLVDEDWLGMSEFVPDDYDFAPTFGDIDGDQDLDLLVGSNGGGLYCYINTAGPGNAMQFERDLNPMWVSMDVGLASTPFVVDLNGDGRKDIVMGERNGNINYFENSGSPTEPIFANSPTVQVLGGVNMTLPLEAVGFSAPVFLQDPGGNLTLVSGAQGGHLESYGDIAPSGNPFTVLSETYGGIDEGNRSHPAFADIDNDGYLEMVVGNFRGGLGIYRTVLVDCGVVSSTKENRRAAIVADIKIYPNPADQSAQVSVPGLLEPLSWRLIDALGRQVQLGSAPDGNFHILKGNKPSGLYFVEIRTQSGKQGSARILFR